MSYRVFARKYRPQTFAEVVGQDHITRTLQNAVNSSRLAQAYLFVGPRGIGKTSTARILAKALNCVKGPTSEPCGVCDVCKGNLVARADDNPEAVRSRLKDYHQKTAPVLELFKRKELIIKVDGTKDANTVQNEIREKLSLIKIV